MEELASSPVKISASKAPITCDRVSPKELKEGQYCEELVPNLYSKKWKKVTQARFPKYFKTEVECILISIFS